MGTVGFTGGAGSQVKKRTDARCPRCYDTFPCGAAAESCWCHRLPPLDLSLQPAELVGKGCLCASCLRAAIRANGAACAHDAD